jgi:hypothetical protein
MGGKRRLSASLRLRANQKMGLKGPTRWWRAVGLAFPTMRSVGLRAGPVLRQQDSPCHARRGDRSRTAPGCEPAGRRRSRPRLASAVCSGAIERSGSSAPAHPSATISESPDGMVRLDVARSAALQEGEREWAAAHGACLPRAGTNGRFLIHFIPLRAPPNPGRGPRDYAREEPERHFAAKLRWRPKKVRQGAPAGIGDRQANESPY